jgi:5'-methylthioadenosine phosphorylase
MPSPSLAVIGGSGLYDIEGFTDREDVEIDTPFGRPSDAITVGKIERSSVAFLPRHGRGHRLMPTEIPAHANIYALKKLGVKQIVSVSAVGSLKEEIEPLDMLVPDQIIDRTRSRSNTFFGQGIVAHVGFADPFCPALSAQLSDVATETGATVHRGGTYVVMEGPAFSTRAESQLYRSWGASVIGMTALPEAKLAREAEMCYATLALVTDYDCWHESEDHVSVELVIANLMKNVDRSKQVIRGIAQRVNGTAGAECSCQSALKDAIITSTSVFTDEARSKLGLLINKYVDSK